MLNVVSKLFSRLRTGRAVSLAPDLPDNERATREVVAAAALCDCVDHAAPPVFDATKLDELKAIMEQAKFTGLVGQFALSLEERIQNLQGLLAQANWPDAAREAHDIVSVAGNIGAARLSALARDLEKSCKAGHEPSCRSLSSAFAGEAADALHALQTYRDAA
jgi:HPt (histidine-containing phosphotransfer) domain-containing protein